MICFRDLTKWLTVGYFWMAYYFNISLISSNDYYIYWTDWLGYGGGCGVSFWLGFGGAWTGYFYCGIIIEDVVGSTNYGLVVFMTSSYLKYLNGGNLTNLILSRA